jgi:hypothetical protein
MAVLVLPGAASLGILLWMRHRLASGAGPASTTAQPKPRGRVISTAQAGRVSALPRRFWLFAFAAGATTAGLVTFGVISYHLTRDHVVPVAAIPVVYALAMGAEAVAAPATGWLYDRINGQVLLALPLLVATVPVLAFADAPVLALTGVLLWGTASGVEDSTVKALVADLVPPANRTTAYGVFAAVQGSTAIVGGVMAGAPTTTLYPFSLPSLSLHSSRPSDCSSSVFGAVGAKSL